MARSSRYRKSRKSAVSRRDGLTWRALGKLVLETIVVVVLMVAIGLLSAIGYRRVTQEAFFPIKRVVLDKPLVYASPQALLDVVKQNGEIDLLHLNVSKLAADMRQLSWVESVSVQKQWLDTVAISVVERIPVVRWGREEYLDPNARPFRLDNNTSLSGLFPIAGPDGAEAKVLQHYRLFQPWLAAHGVEIEAVILDPRLVWHVQLPGEIDVIVGRDELNNRLKKLVLVYDRVVKDYHQHIEQIDLRYQDGVSVRWKAGVEPLAGEA